MRRDRERPLRVEVAPAPSFDGTQACAGADLELFFPTSKGQAAKEATNRAKQLCSGCRFRAACLDYAMKGPQYQGTPGYVSGVWGGTTEQERAAMRRRARTAAAA